MLQCCRRVARLRAAAAIVLSLTVGQLSKAQLPAQTVLSHPSQAPANIPYDVFSSLMMTPVPTATSPTGAFQTQPQAPTVPAASQVFPETEFPYNSSPPELYAPLPNASQTTTNVTIPRPFADYGPPGVLPRPPQAGPAYPLYTPLIVSEPVVTAEERNKSVTAGLFPGTYLIPGSNTSLKFYGFVRLDGIFDLNPIGSTDSFVTSSIPIPQGRGQNAELNPRYTRFGFMSYTPTEVNDWTVETKLEMDFFNGNTSGAFGSFPLRLRFAYLDWGYFRAGQDASVFMDYDVYPNVLDYQGPNGMILMRQPVLRMTLPLGDQVHWAIAIEQPFSDITPSAGGKGIQDVPDLTTNLRYDSGLGHVQVAGLFRKITNQPEVGNDQSLFGWGVNLTGDYHLWAALMGTNPATKENPTGLERSRFLGQYAVGYGMSRYINDVNGLGLDAAAGPNGMFKLIQGVGWFGAYEHWWSEKWTSTFLYGESRLFIPSTLDLPPDTYSLAQYAAVNLVWLPLPNMMIGAEYLYGSRINLNSGSGWAHRGQIAWQYNF